MKTTTTTTNLNTLSDSDFAVLTVLETVSLVIEESDKEKKAATKKIIDLAIEDITIPLPVVEKAVHNAKREKLNTTLNSIIDNKDTMYKEHLAHEVALKEVHTGETLLTTLSMINKDWRKVERTLNRAIKRTNKEIAATY